MKIDCKITVDGRMVSMQVLKMEEKYHGNGLLFKASNGTEIHSVDGPELSLVPEYPIVFARGYIAMDDDRITSRLFKTEQDAQEYYGLITAAIREWNDEQEN
jgi:hypothetical protein